MTKTIGELARELDTVPDKDAKRTISGPSWPFNWHYIVEFIVDIRGADDCEILETKYLTLQGNMDADMYCSDSLCCAEPEDFLPTHFTHHPEGRFDMEKMTELGINGPGVYRLTFGGHTDGCRSWTDCGYEYDVWENYELIRSYKFNDKEVETCWSPKDEYEDPESIDGWRNT